MATRKKAVPEVPEIDDAEQMTDYIDYETLNPALEQIKADLNITGEADVDCHVSKLNSDGNGLESKVWIGDPDAFDLENIAKTFGSGQYRIMVYMKIPSGHKVRKLNKVQAWQLSPADEAKVEAAKHPPEVRQGDSTAALAGMMAQNFQQLGELIVKATQQPQVDPFKQMEAMAGVMSKLIPQPVAKSDAPSFMDMLNMVKTFNEAAGIGKAIPEGTDSSTALLFKGMEMFGPVVQKAMEQKNASPSPAPAALPAPAPVQQSEESEDFMLFKLQLKAANKAAAAGTDAGEFADTIFAILPEQVLQGMAFDPAWFTYLTNAVPDCATYKAWYETVRFAVMEIGVEEGVFTRAADGTLTLAAEPAQNASEPPQGTVDAAGTKPAA